jgi:hypothetical protein
MIELLTGRKKEFNTIIARSGAGKTALGFLLIKHYYKPTLIIDCFNQFKGASMTWSDFLSSSVNLEFLEDFYGYKRQIIIKSTPAESEEIFFHLMNSKRFKDLLIFVDEIDLFLQADRVGNSHSFYNFINRGRHKNFYLITTARNTANIPKPLIAQTDFFYFSDLIEKGAINFVNETLKGLNISETIRNLKKYEFLKVNVNNKKLYRLNTRIEWLEFFNSNQI